MQSVFLPKNDTDLVILMQSNYDANEDESYVTFIVEDGTYMVGQEIISLREPTRAA